MLKSILISMILLTAVLRSHAQVFAGVGLSGTPINEIGPYGVSGFSLMLEKDFSLSKSTRWKMHPSLHVSFLFSELERPLLLSYLNIISLSPKISYEVISGKGVKVAPYASPFISMLWGFGAEAGYFNQSLLGNLKAALKGEYALTSCFVRLPFESFRLPFKWKKRTLYTGYHDVSAFEFVEQP